MAKIYLEPTDNSWSVYNSGAEIIGTSNTNESVTITAGVDNVTVSSTIEAVKLDGDLSQYQFSQGFGSNINIFDSAGNVVATMASVGGKSISVGDEALNITYTDGKVSIGDNDLSSVPMAISGPLSDYTISSSGTTTASINADEVFNITNGNYTHTISNFDVSHDKLNFGAGVTADDITIDNTSDDGMVTLSFTGDAGETVTNIELTGLTSSEDIGLTTASGVDAILL